jgi:hypothetical protein
MDQKLESGAMHGRLVWIISAWYLFVFWSWSVPLYGRNEELFAVSLVIMLSGFFLAIVSFTRFLYELRKSALRQSLPDNDFIVRVLIDLGALTMLSRFSMTMNRISESFDNDAVLLLVAGVIMLTLLYGVIRVLIGVSSIRSYLGMRWRAVTAIMLAVVVAGAWYDVLRALHLAMAAIGVAPWADAIPQKMALNALWYDGYVFSLVLLTLFLFILGTSFGQFRMIYADMGKFIAGVMAGLKKPQPKSKVSDRVVSSSVAAVRPARGRKTQVKAI